MKLHQTAGIILFNKKMSKVYMIHNLERDEWLLPKGHIEDGESVIQAAKRELVEETGYMEFVVLGNNPCHVSDFRFKDKDGKMARKQISFFVAIILSKKRTGKDQTGEWLTLKKAKDVASYDDVVDTIDRGYEYIKSISNCK